jgi:hypothetical protein
LTKSQNAATAFIIQNADSSDNGALAYLAVRGAIGGLSITMHGKARTVTRYGHALGRWCEITTDSNAFVRGMMIGTREARPLILGTNELAVVTIDSLQKVGIGTEMPTGKLTIRGKVASSDTLLNLRSSLGKTVAWVDTLGNMRSKSLMLEAVATMADTTGWQGIHLFTFNGDSLYVYKATHTINAFAKL